MEFDAKEIGIVQHSSRPQSMGLTARVGENHPEIGVVKRIIVPLDFSKVIFITDKCIRVMPVNSENYRFFNIVPTLEGVPYDNK